jgi:hypothetical protein
MKANAIFPGKYLRADDLNGAEPTVTISHIKVETLGEDSKPVLYFAGKDKGVVLNKTNWTALVDITGEDDSDNWEGKRVKLVVRKVDFQGKRMPANRIEEPAGAKKREPEPVMDREPGDEDDDSISF